MQFDSTSLVSFTSASLIFDDIPLPPIETRPGGSSSVIRHTRTKNNSIREDYRPEREGVCANSCDEDDGVFRVAEGATGSEVVGRAACGGGDADAVGLDGGEVFIVAEDFDGGHGWRGRS